MRSQPLRAPSGLYFDRNVNVPNLNFLNQSYAVNEQCTPVTDNSFQGLERSLAANDHDRFINH